MTSKRILYFMFVLAFALSACSAAPLAEAPTVTATVRPTRTATASPLPTFTASPTPQVISIVKDSSCRSGPGEQYEQVTVLDANTDPDNGEYYAILLATSGSYWMIQLSDGQQCWVESQYELAVLPQGTQAAFTPLASSTPFTPTAAPAPVEAVQFSGQKCNVAMQINDNKKYEVTGVDIVISLSWADVAGEDGYFVYRDGNQVAELPMNTTQYTDHFPLVKGGRTSTYIIVAYNALGESKSAPFSIKNPC